MGTLRSEVERILMLVLSEDTHLKESPGAVQVKVTVSIGHGLSTLTEYWALWNMQQCKEIYNNWMVSLTSAEASQKANQENSKELYCHLHWPIISWQLEGCIQCDCWLYTDNLLVYFLHIQLHFLFSYLIDSIKGVQKERGYATDYQPRAGGSKYEVVRPDP